MRQDTLAGLELSLLIGQCKWEDECWDGEYQVVYCDPPWKFRLWSGKEEQTRSAAKHYATLSIDELKQLNVQNIAAEDSVLFMWVTPPILQEAFAIIDAWGFEYKTKAFAWVKTTKRVGKWHWGMGYYTRANTEDCLLATRGKGLSRASKGVHQVIYDDTLIAPVGEHSAKPPEARDRIVELFGDVPRIELFARKVVLGWHGHGLEYPGKGIEIGFSDELEMG